MPTDAKCGLAVGLAVVVAVAVLYFRGEPPAETPAPAETKSRTPAAAVQPPQPTGERATRPPATTPGAVNGEPGA